MPVYRHRTELSGWTGALGINTHWFRGDGLGTADADEIGNAIRSVYDDAKLYLISDARVLPEPFLDILDEATGQLAGTINMTTSPTQVVGGGTGKSLSRATQVKLRFRTGVVRDGRYIAGGIFFGPVASGAVSNDGSVTGSAASVLAQAYETHLGGLTGNGRHAVYRQPRRNHPTLPDRDGVAAVVTAYDTKPLPAVLRSRRD